MPYGLIIPLILSLSMTLRAEVSWKAPLSPSVTVTEKYGFFSDWIQKNPQDTHALFNLALISLESHKRAQAHGLLKRVLNLDPGFQDAYLALQELSGTSMRESLRSFIFRFVDYSFLIPLHIASLFLLLGLWFVRQKRFIALSFVLFVLTSFLVFDKTFQLFNPKGTVLVENLSPKSAPEKNFEGLFSVAQGETVSLIGKKEDWIQVRTERGKVGWIKKETVLSHNINFGR